MFLKNESAVNIASNRAGTVVWGTSQASGEFTISLLDGITVPRPQGS